MKKQTWSSLTKTERLSATLYPHLASKEIQDEMQAIAKHEGKKPPGNYVKQGGYAVTNRKGR